ncbi:MAG: sulfite oxidase [Streptosporangiaceae bacterium]
MTKRSAGAHPGAPETGAGEMTAGGVQDVVSVADPEHAWQQALQAGLVGRKRLPLNCELPPPLLTGPVTANERFFRRNHFPIPDLDAGRWRLDVGGLVRTPLSLGLEDLRRLGSESVVATLECAGNGRTLFSAPVEGETWGLGAVSSARWTGVPLTAVLDRAGIASGAREVIFRGADGGQMEGVEEPIRYERSLSVADARQSGALLVFAMNGEPLPARHGFPVRLVVPGWYAMASVKWLTEVELTDQPFTGFFQDTHYVYEWQRRGAWVREPVRLQRIRALVAEPADGQVAEAGDLVVRGVAWSGAAPISRVEVSIAAAADGETSGGETGGGRAGADAAGAAEAGWQQAHLVGRAEGHGWQRWELTARDVPPGAATIRARAYDQAGNGQLSEPEWNNLGYGGNFVHELTVTLS